VKNGFSILAEIALNLQITLGSMDNLTILVLSALNIGCFPIISCLLHVLPIAYFLLLRKLLSAYLGFIFSLAINVVRIKTTFQGCYKA
jgi:hypothetical protein